MIRTIAVDEEGLLKKNLPIETLIAEGFLWYWIDFDQPDEKENLLLRDLLHFHPLAIEDCIYWQQRPKLNYFEDHTFFITQSMNPSTFTKEELDFFVGDHFIVTYHHTRLEEVNKMWRLFHNEVNVREWDSYKVLHFMIDELVDQYFPIAYEIEDTLGKIDENSQNESMETLLEELFAARQKLLMLRRTVSPMRDLVYRMLNSHRLPGIMNHREYFLDIYDHLLKLSEMIDANREITADIRDSYLSYNSHQTNRVMKILTVFTTIFMPLTFIAGIYGMNFANMPELHWKYGYFSVMFIMAGIGYGMYVYFQKKGWFK
ncbi:magnesium/cobalt transporter CorA [Bacillus benzoevorans]|uniref:Magnesium transport protein CorA n=1 Tax=Bacillus benzoevorans TaxID=1456 RepID=A0A7X0LUN9_9BACI|nr:magnesium/cobalt transporter CorA [Bacillus benzoevorans]MBB6443444.1 magnesium transporter [Bacillus benzoevorans]